MYFVSPQAYSRQAAQLSTQGLLNACAFYVQYGSDALFSPGYGGEAGSAGVLASTPRYRYRLMQALESTENLRVYASVANRDTNWINNLKYQGSATTVSQHVAPLADNVIALIVWPRLSETDDASGVKLSPGYSYNSRPETISAVQAATDNQMPPDVSLTMVTISDAAARRLDTNGMTPPAIIEGALANKFTDVRNYQKDLDGLSSVLIANHIDYRIFTTSVPMKTSKWSNGK